MKQYIKKNEYETVNLDDEWIIMNTDNFTVTKLNAIGGYCWTLLEKPQSSSSLSQSVKQKYDLQNKSLLTDVEEFLEELIEYGLVHHAV